MNMNSHQPLTNNMLSVLMYLFENHMRNDSKIMVNREYISQELEQAGFPKDVINKALHWLDTLKQQQQMIHDHPPQKTSIRIFNDQEKKKISLNARGLLLRLEQMAILTPVTREIVIGQIMQLDRSIVDSNLTKWVVLMILFSQPDQKNALLCMEHLILNDNEGLMQ